MANESDRWNVINWIFYILFLTVGVLNIFLVHPIPGIFYILLTFIYLPSTNVMLKKKLGFSIPSLVKVTLGILVLWATLAVSDLMELFETWALN